MATRTIGDSATLIRRKRFSETYIGEWLTTTDHKLLGIMYVITGIFFFLVGGMEALLIRTQLALPDGKVLSPQTYNEVFTMHGTTMIFLFVIPVMSGFGNYVVPLMIGARDMAFPRMNAFGYWVLLFGGIFMQSSFLFASAPNGGWFMYAPLSETNVGCTIHAYTCTPGMNADFWILGVLMLGISSIAGSVNFVVTIFKLRAPGMSINRMPLFTWMTLVTSFLLLFALPSITAASVMLLLDRHLGTHFYQYAFNGDPLLWQHLFWSFGHPEVYILILPAFGIVSEVLPVFSRKPIFGYTFVAWSGVAIGFLSFTVWAHHMFAVGLPPIAQAFFATSTTLIAIPTAVKIFNWLATIYGGKLNFKVPMLFALGFVAMFLIGGLNGVALAVVPVDYQITDTYFVVAHIHYVLFGGSVFAIMAGVYYWFPKMAGKMLSERLGQIQFWLFLIGINLTFFPMHLLGLLGMPRRIYTYPANLGWNDLNLMATVGVFVIAIGVLVFIWNVFYSLKNGEKAPEDPWDAFTLEWDTASPPKKYNFLTIPVVRSRRPFYDKKYPENADWKAAAH
ncbi:cytochrome c oxidase subunit I [Ktedonosporobacter rubrisoli]|uniref:Cytochrome c oxidase subunit 1 n=1 Tax=Ktedonosporobacter rubrisoli TaxID=2509675 RepID=A0A4P6JZX0_KTERU|nr:cytochrome c oxidase subunit I [Ktedonosporobacter rubrisoli]QBD81205.1 cytochrome c oxidase subunit I [Ktedonosporobacter rubrisoli]